ADGWLAVNLARPDDLDLLPAWLAGSTIDPAESAEGPERFTDRNGGQSARASADTGEFRVPSDIWRDLAAAVALMPAEPLVERAAWLGLPVAALRQTPEAL